jgi:hypothetical protein
MTLSAASHAGFGASVAQALRRFASTSDIRCSSRATTCAFRQLTAAAGTVYSGIPFSNIDDLDFAEYLIIRRAAECT